MAITQSKDIRAILAATEEWGIDLHELTSFGFGLQTSRDCRPNEVD